MKSKYGNIANQLRKDIKDKIYTERLPSEKKLATRFNTTQITVRKALDILVAEGVLVKRPPLGTFIEQKEKPKAQISMLLPLFRNKEVENISSLIKGRIPELELRVESSNSREFHYSDFDLLRSGNLSTVSYNDFAAPFPGEMINKFKFELYFEKAFDIHRINRFYYAIPYLFSPMLISVDQSVLESTGHSQNPYSLNFDSLLNMIGYAKKENKYLLDYILAQMFMKSLVFSAGDESNLLANVDIKKLNDLIEKSFPIFENNLVHNNNNDLVFTDTIFHYCCRQGMRNFDSEKNILMVFPEEIRKKGGAAGEFFILNGRSKNMETAIAVAEQFLSPEIQGMIGRERIGIPVLKSAAVESIDSHTYRDDLFFNEIRNICANSAVEHDFIHRLHAFVDDIIAGKMDKKEFIHCLEYEINMARRKRNNQESSKWSNLSI